MNRHYASRPQLLAIIIMIMAGVLVNSVAWAQATVTGKVLDEAGQPLPGVNVVEKGTSSGTTPLLPESTASG